MVLSTIKLTLWSR